MTPTASDFQPIADAERAQARHLLAMLRTAQRVCRETPVAWLEIAGGVVGFLGPEHPYGRAMGVGLDGPVDRTEREAMLSFLRERGSPLRIECCAASDPSLLDGLRARPGATVVHVHRRSLAEPMPPSTASPIGERWRSGELTLSLASGADAALAAETVGRGFHPDGVPPAFREHGAITAAKPDGALFLVRRHGAPIAGGRVDWVDGPRGRVAILTGMSTVVDGRRLGAQAALLAARLRAAREAGCVEALVLCTPGSASERNIARAGFRLAYAKRTVIVDPD